MTFTPFKTGLEVNPGFTPAGKYLDAFPQPDFTFAGTPQTPVQTTPSPGSAYANFADNYEKYGEKAALALLEYEKGGKDDWLNDLVKTQLDPDYQKMMLENNLEYNRRLMADAAPYNFAYKIPERLIQAATLPATVALGASNNVAKTLGQFTPNVGGFAVAGRTGGYF